MANKKDTIRVMTAEEKLERMYKLGMITEELKRELDVSAYTPEEKLSIAESVENRRSRETLVEEGILTVKKVGKGNNKLTELEKKNPIGYTAEGMSSQQVVDKLVEVDFLTENYEMTERGMEYTENKLSEMDKVQRIMLERYILEKHNVDRLVEIDYDDKQETIGHINRVDDILPPKWTTWDGAGVYEVPARNFRFPDKKKGCLLIGEEGVTVYSCWVSELNKDEQHDEGVVFVTSVEDIEEFYTLGNILDKDIIEECEETFKKYVEHFVNG